jgi:histidine triad (HIT) family protein
MECVFCEKSSIKNRIIYESGYALAFLTNIPITEGHTLIIPKRCVKRFEDLNPIEKDSIFNLMEKIKKALAKTYGSEGFNIAWNENEVAGQNVPHFHIHIVPRKEGDKGIHNYDPRLFLYRPGTREITDELDLEKNAIKIKDNFG